MAEVSERDLKTVRQLNAPGARDGQEDLEEADLSEVSELPGAIVLEELVVEVVHQAPDELVCGECFSLRHRSQVAREFDGVKVCRDCAEP